MTKTMSLELEGSSRSPVCTFCIARQHVQILSSKLLKSILGCLLHQSFFPENSRSQRRPAAHFNVCSFSTKGLFDHSSLLTLIYNIFSTQEMRTHMPTKGITFKILSSWQWGQGTALIILISKRQFSSAVPTCIKTIPPTPTPCLQHHTQIYRCPLSQQ